MKCILYKKALPLILLSCLLLGACGNSKNDSVSKEPLSHTSTEKGTWDSAPKVLTPTADGTQTYTCDVASIDASNSGSGYIIVNYHGSNQKVKLQMTVSRTPLICMEEMKCFLWLLQVVRIL